MESLIKSNRIELKKPGPQRFVLSETDDKSIRLVQKWVLTARGFVEVLSIENDNAEIPDLTDRDFAERVFGQMRALHERVLEQRKAKESEFSTRRQRTAIRP